VSEEKKKGARRKKEENEKGGKTNTIRSPGTLLKPLFYLTPPPLL